MNSNPFFLSILLALIIIVSWFSGITPIFRNWDRKYLRLFISFGAGSLLGASFIHMIPEAAETIGSQIGVTTLAGFIFLFIIEKFTMIHACEGEHCDFHEIGIVAFIGLSMHSLIDGFIMATTAFLPALGSAVFFAIIAHKIPASLSLGSILVMGNYSKRKIIFLISLFCLTLPIGALTAVLILTHYGSFETGIAISISAGTFIHLAASDLLPEVHRTEEGRFQNLISFFTGIAFMGIIKYISV